MCDIIIVNNQRRAHPSKSHFASLIKLKKNQRIEPLHLERITYANGNICAENDGRNYLIIPLVSRWPEMMIDVVTHWSSNVLAHLTRENNYEKKWNASLGTMCVRCSQEINSAQSYLNRSV